jgi:SAM-dependent methyltransferase
MPFADSTFDMVFSNSVLEHIPTIDRTLAEVGRILRPGGELAFTVPSDHFVTCLQGPARRRARGREDEAQAYIDMLDRRLQHHHYLSPSAWGRKLEQAGLCLEKHVYYLDRASLQTWERLHQWTAGIALRLVRNGHHPHERHDRWSLPVTRDVQRRWHLLAARRALPAGLIARALFVPLWQALRQARNEDRIGGCLLVIARKPTTSAPLRGVMAESEPHG